MSAALVREVHALDANLALYEMITLQEQVNRTSPQLVAVTLVSILGGLALLLAGVGMTVTAMTACLLPAWCASRTDPARVLRD